MTTLQIGSIEAFFASAKATARECDHGEPVTPKHRIWVEADDLTRLITPERMRLIRLPRGKRRVTFHELRAETRRSVGSLNRDLKLFAKYHLIEIDRKTEAGGAREKVITPTYGEEIIEVRVET